MNPTWSRLSLASSSGPASTMERPPMRTVPRVGVRMHPRIDKRPHQQRQFTALERQAHALESLDLSRSIAEQFHDIDGLDDGVGHRVNTIPGSMRVTCTIAPIAAL